MSLAKCSIALRQDVHVLSCLERKVRDLVAVQKEDLGFAGGWRIVMYKCGEDYMCDAMQKRNLKFSKESSVACIYKCTMKIRHIARWAAEMTQA